ncbi:4F2 cell-surface antigen heavy chain-like isoform X2 [Homarus americanus]|uniref:4F2 cell-surface antigen heavy chain-like isoform X2 n=1 Tax=Homarus americanus TaxID=6706 RepID=UPI001C46DCF9|nr:4F2 cell-surface antigen heavy chain-like isoform X2 [Homarus americanus]
MTEEKTGVKNGAANTEMAPQEDGTKVPLTNDSPEVKFTTGNDPPNGDVKIDLPAPTFNGLSKEELMKYSDDPFWIRLRWALFILFWVGWAAMLVVAIVIIIQAPRCAPKETLDWVQESAMIKYDLNAPIEADNTTGETHEDLIKMAADLGITTVYLEDLISPQDFENINTGLYTKNDVLNVLKAASANGLHVVTDFVPTQVGEDNTWFQDPEMKSFFKPNSRDLDFGNSGLLEKLTKLFSGVWKEKGVDGYLMKIADTEELLNASIILNKNLEAVDGAVVHGIVDLMQELVAGFEARIYREFLDEHAIDSWSYYKFNPTVAQGKISEDYVRLVTLSLFLVPGTPILDGINNTYFENQKTFIKSLSDIREKESVQVGKMNFVNGTDEDVIAFARNPVMKGTPGYAVAINMHNSNNATVNFTSIPGVSDKGDNALRSTVDIAVNSHNLGRSDMSSVFLGPLEGLVIQFVPSF